jgi:methyl-accepting chemotaxis protein
MADVKLSSESQGPFGRGAGAGKVPSGFRVKRTHYLVDSKAQLRFALHMTLLLVIGGLLELGFVYVLWQLKGTLTTDLGAVIGDPLLNLLPWIYVLVVLSVNVLVFVLIGMFYYHRIAGPSLHIVRSLQSISDGDLTVRVRLRKGDHLEEIAAATDDLAEEWNALVLQMRRELQAIKALPEPVDKAALGIHLEAVELGLAGFRLKE